MMEESKGISAAQHEHDQAHGHHHHHHGHYHDEHIANAVGADIEEISHGYWKSPQFLGSFLALVFMANSLFFGYSVPVNILSIIDADVGPSTNISLVSLVNTMGQGTWTLLFGGLSDAVGRRYFIIFGQVVGLIGAIISAKAPDVNTLIGGAVFSGMAGAVQVLYPLLVMEIVPNKYRGFAQALITFAVIPSLGLGPIVGRAIVSSTGTWRWTYWLSAIFNGIALVLLVAFYFPPSMQELQNSTSKWKQVRQIDYVGFVIYVGGLCCLLLGLTWGGGLLYPWSSAIVTSLLVVGCVCLVAFFFYEYYAPVARPILPLSLFRIRNFNIALVVGSIGQMSYYALNVFWPTHVQTLYTTDDILVGWITCTTGMALVMGEVISGPFLKLFGHAKYQLTFSSVGLTLFGGLMAYANQYREDYAIAFTIGAGFFIGWLELIAIVMCGLVVPPDQIGIAQAFFSSTRAVTGTIAASIYLVIFNGKIGGYLASNIQSSALAAGLPATSVPALLAEIANGTAAGYETVSGVDSSVLAAIGEGTKTAYYDALSMVYLASVAFGGLAIMLAFLTRPIDEYMTGFVNKTVQGRKAREEMHEKHERHLGQRT